MPGLRIFLSSTATDLVEYRRIADDTLLRLRQQSVVMERFGALPGTPVAECERLAASSDAVVCIVAHRYGYEPEAGRGSITRREVEAARRAGKPVYAWIVDDKHPWTEAKEQDRLTQPDVLADPAKAFEVVAAIKGLQDFKAWLRSNFVTDTFTTPDNLAAKIATKLANVQPSATAPSRSSPHTLHQVSEALSESEAYLLLCDADSQPTFESAKELLDRINARQFRDPDLVTCIVFSKNLVEFCVAAGVPRDAEDRVSSFWAMMRKVNKATLLSQLIRHPLKTLGDALTIRQQIALYPDMMWRLSQKYGREVAGHRPGRS